MTYILCEDVINYTDQDKAMEYLVDTKNGKIFQLNETAKIIVYEIKEGKDEKGIVDKVALEFKDVKKQQIKEDTHEYIDALINSGMISIKDN